VLETAMNLSDGREAEEEVATYLQRGRVLRLAGRFDEARESYTVAGDLATAISDKHSELLSRIGQAIVSQKVGNLPEAERMLREVLQEARATGDRDAEARACHDLGNVLENLGRASEAVPLIYRAFEFYRQQLHKLRALSDLGTVLKTMHMYGAAEDAFLLVVQSDAPPETRTNTILELVEISALRKDRLAFERWRREAQAGVVSSPYLHVDFEFKVGIGLTSFGLRASAEKYLRNALRRAEEHGLNHYVFRAEAALK
jgi:tetratricopeptide (TPR) repeat protein